MVDPSISRGNPEPSEKSSSFIRFLACCLEKSSKCCVVLDFFIAKIRFSAQYLVGRLVVGYPWAGGQFPFREMIGEI